MSLMCAYNSIHGVPACASSPLMTPSGGVGAGHSDTTSGGDTAGFVSGAATVVVEVAALASFAAASEAATPELLAALTRARLGALG